MHLVSFTIEIYYDARPCECQKLNNVLEKCDRKWSNTNCTHYPGT